MSVAPTPVEVEGLFSYARVAPGPRRASDREVTTVAGRTPRAPFLRSLARPEGAMAQRLVALGLADAGLAAAVERECTTAASLLERVDRVVRVDTDAMGSELHMDRVAARLGALTGVLRHASFEQIALEDVVEDESDVTSSTERPIELDAEGESTRISSLPDDAVIPADAPIVGLARLRAHVGLTTWEIYAIDRGPWLDLAAILGLLNAMLRHLESPMRLVVLAGDDPSARVLAAPMEAIEAAVAEGLFTLEGPDDALLRSFDDGDPDHDGHDEQ
ncbi:MAG: hypothetical protein J0L92_28870 [Deltaproteobacteria bacterium]|nr:hypothetical protein [Deltaproteobacteria bacterium]